jgi:hypothetical protein
MEDAMSTAAVKVLLVGQSAKGFSFLLRRLENLECDCYVATSSLEAAQLSVGRAFDLVLCTDRAEWTNALIASLVGSRTTLFRCYPVEDSCWWLPSLRYGEKCLGAPALRPSDFTYVLDSIVEEIRSGKNLSGEVADPGDEPEQRDTELSAASEAVSCRSSQRIQS